MFVLDGSKPSKVGVNHWPVCSVITVDRRQPPRNPSASAGIWLTKALVPPDRERIHRIRVETMGGRVGIVAPFRTAVELVLNRIVGKDPVVVGLVRQIPRPGPTGAEVQVLPHAFRGRNLQRVVFLARRRSHTG